MVDGLGFRVYCLPGSAASHTHAPSCLWFMVYGLGFRVQGLLFTW